MANALSIFKNKFCIGFILLFSVLLFDSRVSFADIYMSIFAVNGTDVPKKKEIKQLLPKELKAEDILDTEDLKADYDVNEGAYYVHGTISLGAKESRTLKIRIRDVWKFDEENIAEIKKQIDLSLERLKGTEYYDNGLIKKQSLLQRIDFILKQQADAIENVQKRIDRYRVYADEIAQIRRDSLSVKYWRSKPPEAGDDNTFKWIIEIENPSDVQTKKIEKQYYLPTEVKPEHLVNLEGFEVRYDSQRGQAFLTREEELQPREIKRYEVSILDMWNVPRMDIENLKDRARKVFKLLEKTEYVESANYLVASIKDKLDKVETTQGQAKDIYEHVSTYRANVQLYLKSLDDVRSLEELLEAVRETLERSQLKNVLQKVQSFKSISKLAEAIFKTTPTLNNAWKIIIGIVIFVGIFTAFHFSIWGRRSREAKKAKAKEQAEQEKKQT